MDSEKEDVICKLTSETKLKVVVTVFLQFFTGSSHFISLCKVFAAADRTFVNVSKRKKILVKLNVRTDPISSYDVHELFNCNRFASPACTGVGRLSTSYSCFSSRSFPKSSNHDLRTQIQQVGCEES